MFDDQVDSESKEGGLKIDIGGTEDESNKRHKFFTGTNPKIPDFKNRIPIIIGFMCICFLLVLISITAYFHSQRGKRENLKNLSIVSTASPDIVDRQYIKDSLNKIQPFENKLMNRVTDKSKKTDSFNKRSIDINDYLDDLNNYKKSSSDELSNLQKVSCATEVNNYRSNIIKEYQVFIDGLTHEANYINSKLTGKETAEMTVSQGDYKNLVQVYKENSNELNKVQNLCK
ncbi:hypothetical protein ACJDT4_13865 [Clostridium neuense]|uniref:Uncharacterized protein n=1 Tax=Clostridium neuense TaxID=1728934 RepID=A0ABW8TGE0_9CLOT